MCYVSTIWLFNQWSPVVTWESNNQSVTNMHNLLTTTVISSHLPQQYLVLCVQTWLFDYGRSKVFKQWESTVVCNWLSHFEQMCIISSSTEKRRQFLRSTLAFLYALLFHVWNMSVHDYLWHFIELQLYSIVFYSHFWHKRSHTTTLQIDHSISLQHGRWLL